MKVSIDDFDWPCSLRVAHGEHDLTEDPDEPIIDRLWCPGVRAHPFTQIGGDYGPSGS